MTESHVFKIIAFVVLAGIINSCTKDENDNFSGPGGTFVDNRDMVEYSWVRIGDQIWMAENLAYLPSVSPSAEDSDTDPYYYVYDYQGSNVTEAKVLANLQTYGVLYNWVAALNACPSGWHLPTDDEWKTLEMHLGMSQEQADDKAWRGTDEGGKLKETGTSHWSSPNTGATNESGFTALPAGCRSNDGNFYYLGDNAYLWSATWGSASYSLRRYIRHDSANVNRRSQYKGNGFSVRCIMD